MDVAALPTWLLYPQKKLLWSSPSNLSMTEARHLKRGRTVVNGCPMCLGDEESVDHLMLNYKIVQSIWRVVVGWFDCCWVFPNSLLELFQVWKAQLGFIEERNCEIDIPCYHMNNMEGKELKIL